MWLNQLPDTWDLLPLKRVVTLKTSRVTGNSGKEDFIGLEHIESWTGRLLKAESIEAEIDNATDSKRIVNSFDSGDILFCKLRPYLAKAYLAEKSGTCTTELLVMKPGEQLCGRFLLHTLLSHEFIEKVSSETFGAKMPRADWNIIGNIEIPLPPLHEQRCLAEYLDRQTTTINALIAARQKLLTLLAEKRRALVTHAVTHGLNPDAPYFDSDIEWLGKIPRHWVVERLKFLVSSIEGGFSPQCYNFPANEGEWGVLKTGCVNGGVFNSNENKTLPENVEPPLELKVHVGDVLMSRASGSLDLIGSVALVDSQPQARLLLSDKTFRLKVNSDICDPRFFVIVMGSFPLRQQILLAISGAEGLANNIAQSDIWELLLPLPPLEEQQRIVSFVERECAKLGKLSDVAVRTIELLQERRTALISAAVTGQLKIPA
jgi:type I restriction enzyme S subunit